LAVRIYSLAKELKLDSKELVERCAEAGIQGKGSALASLTDEEEVTLRAFLAGGGKPAPAKRPAAKPAAIPVAAPPAPVAPVARVIVPAPQPPAETGAMRREDYMAPTGASEKVPVLGEKPQSKLVRKKATNGETSRPAAKAPAIKLAPLPKMEVPLPSKSKEPVAQKPDIKLPMDVIRASKAGSKPLSDHMKKAEQKRDETVQQQAAARRAPGAPGATSDPKRDRARRGFVAAEAPATSTPGSLRDRGKKVKTGTAQGDADSTLLGGREQRQLNRKKTTSDQRRRGGGALLMDEEEIVRRRRLAHRPKLRHQHGATAPRKSKVALQLPISVRAFCEAVGVPVQQVLKKLLELGTMGSINAELNGEVVEYIAADLGIEIEVKQEIDFVEDQLATVRDVEDDPATLEARPPVITFLGHVDHGKTSLLDKLIGINVVSGESGGITQHIRAYQIDRDGRKISFVDTPGHEAFTEMRARGANVTDIAVLVVAADDGVMPQTEEAISHIKAAGVPIVVALNKIDLPGVDVQRIYQQLATAELLPTEWGGDTEVVKTSAISGEGLDQLLETLLTIAELHNFQANPDRPAVGTCLEAELHEGRGVIAKFIVQNGTLKVGDSIVCGSSFGRVKAMYDTLKPSRQYKAAGPSTPVNLTGLDMAPQAGEHFYVIDRIDLARQIAEERGKKERRTALSGPPIHVTLETLFERLGQEEQQSLNLIMRADVRGSIEAIQKELTKLDHPEVKIKILQASVGGITEGDVYLADASDAIIIGFNVVPDEKARGLADRRGVQVRRYDIIYKVTEDLKAALEGMLKPEKREMELGRALVQRTFTISRVGTIAGCRVLAGVIQRNCRMRVTRDSRVIGEYGLDSLKREKDDAREVREGMECGIKLAGFNDIKEGDILEAYKIEEVARTL
jgi:translation initiation factor IF-2